LDSGGHGEIESPTTTVEHPEFFKEHEDLENSATDAGGETFHATTQPVAISNGQATCGEY